MGVVKTFVVSGINIFEGGPLTVYLDFLRTLLELKVYEEYEIVAFVHKKSLFMGIDNITFIELPLSRKGYLFRFYYEYLYFKKYSANKDIDIWVSMHDMTPNVYAKELYTYCHNSIPFYNANFKTLIFAPRNFIMSKLYRYIYQINLHKASAVIVQQDWLRREFINLYGEINVMVSRPTIHGLCDNSIQKCSDVPNFVYAAYPRVFKNFEVICEAAMLLYNEGYNFRVLLTVDGSECRYSRYLVKKYGNCPAIQWMGIIDKEKVNEIYSRSKALIFPSKLETWGLPITEYKLYGKDIILANLPYAHETLGKYDRAMFFEPDCAKELAEKMAMVITDSSKYDVCEDIIIEEPFFSSWEELVTYLVRERRE